MIQKRLYEPEDLLTLPDGDGIEPSGTLLIQRGDLAHVRQFTYLGVGDIAAAIKDAYIALAAVEAEPPILPEPPKATPKPAPAAPRSEPPSSTGSPPAGTARR